MIDYEVNIFDRVYKAVGPKCAKGKFVSQQVASPTGFPAAALYELSNRTVKSRQSSTPVENFARIMYQFEAYAQTKAKAKEVYKAGDDVMIALGFTRVSGDFIDNAGNTDVFRYVARYEAEIDRNGVIYRVP